MIPSLIRNRNKSTLPAEPCPIEASKIELLSAMDIFQDLSGEEVEALMNSTPISTARKGAKFHGADGGPEVLFLLKEGKAELYRLSPEGKKLTLAIVEKGEFFGEMSLVGQRLVDTHAVALEDSVICALSRHDLEMLILEHPRVALRLIAALARRLQDARDALSLRAFMDVTGRVAGLLLKLAGEDSNLIEGYSHQNLAAMVGCLRESFTVVLDEFKKSGALTVGRKRVEITDREQLERAVLQRTGGVV